MRYVRSAIFVLMGAALAAPNAYAQSQTTIGVLTCTSGASIEGKGAADNPNQMTCGFKAHWRRGGAALFGRVQDGTERGRTGRQARVGVVGRGARNV